MAIDINTANAITDGLEKHGGWFLSACLMLVVVWQALVARRDRLKAHEEVIAALSRSIPLTEKLLSALAIADAKNRRRREDVARPIGEAG